MPGMEARLIELSQLLKEFYGRVWVCLSKEEKFILYDFALDGFSNHRDTKILYQLINKGILFYEDLTLTTMTLGFREFVLEKREDDTIVDQMTVANAQDTWRKVKIPLLILLSAFGIFLFITQDQIYQKITGLLTSSSSLITLISGLLTGRNK
jgi:hypothetical protein